MNAVDKNLNQNKKKKKPVPQRTERLKVSDMRMLKYTHIVELWSILNQQSLYNSFN